MIMMMGITSVISVAVALAIVYFVVVPKLSHAPAGEEGAEPEEEVAEPAEGGGHGGGEGKSEPTTLVVSFDESYSTLVMPSPDIPASILQYKISLDCGNMTAKNLVEANKARFTAKIRELHSYKKRAEVDNPQLEQDILKQVVQESNAILQELTGKPSEKTRVVAAYHEKFFVQDL